MVISGRSVHLTTIFFLGKLEQAVNQYFVHILSIVTDNNPSRMGGENYFMSITLCTCDKSHDHMAHII